MNKNSALGPDGFGSAFYYTLWSHIAPQIERLLAAFYNNHIDLARINRAHIILLAKKQGIVGPDAWFHSAM
jgi:hypothetical protein